MGMNECLCFDIAAKICNEAKPMVQLGVFADPGRSGGGEGGLDVAFSTASGKV
jgi:hypothetical protein